MRIVLRIAGRVSNKKKDNETLKRLSLDRKFSCTLVDEKDSVKIGMVNAVAHMVAFGKADEDLLKKMKKRESKKKGVYHLHPPRGGFKKSSKVAAPRGILGHNKEITKLIERML